MNVVDTITPIVKEIVEVQKKYWERFKECNHVKNIKFDGGISVADFTDSKSLCKEIINHILNKEALITFESVHQGSIRVEHYSKYIKIKDYKDGMFREMLDNSGCMFEKEVVLLSGDKRPLSNNTMRELLKRMAMTFTPDYLAGKYSSFIIPLTVMFKEDYVDVLSLTRMRSEVEKTLNKHVK
jgi:hypothetical protein